MSCAQPSGTLLITPLGLSKGVLYSVLHHIAFDRAIVITSREAALAVDEILQLRGVLPGAVRIIKMEEPVAGFAEAHAIGEQIREDIRQAKTVIINYAGGSTAMQYAVQNAARIARNLGSAIQEGAVVDRRSVEEQRRQPFIVGEWIRLPATP